MVFLTRRSERTIFFSSHQLPDVERVADYIAVLDHSVLRACCPLETFRNSVRQVRLRFPSAVPPLPKIPGLLQAIRSEGELRVTCVHYNGATEAALRALAPAEMEQATISLEDAFISYLGDRGEKSFILSETEAQL
jgi:ABC-2 type transport system ATP-binding protein